ncbi:MAG: TRZ/ATZ family hydrolase, partial [Halieaceae bacterium]|nr:TRZ/ATZ family hydrolase [Halieaceae bacterium]
MASSVTTADILLRPRWIVPVIPRGVVLEEHCLAITDDSITALLPRHEADKLDVRKIIDLPGQVLIPGLVNCHGHAGMSLLRGFADDLSLMPWLQDHIWPAEKAHVSAQFA